MLSYERVTYDSIKEECCSSELEYILEENETQIEKYASNKSVEVEVIKRQIRLHIPQFEKKLYNNRDFLKKYVFPVIDKTILAYKCDFDKYLNLCGANIFDTPSTLEWSEKKKGNSCIISGENNKIECEIKTVDERAAWFIENKLHYLRASRKNSVLRLGLYIKNYTYPICYMNFCVVDREDKLLALNKSIDGNMTQNTVVELARVFGCGKLPKNTVSLLVAYAAKCFREKEYIYIITAVNITLGFSGDSMIASKFNPYAIRPVSYYYDKKRHFCTKRKRKKYYSNILPMPPNILFVREIKPSNGRKIKYCRLIDIGNNYSINETAIEHEIYKIRKELESVWSEKTRYHGTVMNGINYISKGQCGVSSLLLARLLVNRGYEIRFCEGDTIFLSHRNNNIYNHCWIKIINYNNRKENVIIDITADQNGYAQKIVFKTEADLEKLNIQYNIKTEKHFEDVDVEHLIKRLTYLEQELNEGGIRFE